MQKEKIEKILHPLNKVFIGIYVGCLMIGISGSGCKGSRPEQVKKTEVKTVEVKTSDSKVDVEIKSAETSVNVITDEKPKFDTKSDAKIDTKSDLKTDTKVDVIVKAGEEAAKK